MASSLLTIPEFFNGLYAYCDPGLLELRMLPGPGRNKPYSRFVDSFEEAARVAEKESMDIYYGVGLRKEPGGKKEHVQSIPALWADVDIKDFDSENDAKRAMWERAPLGVGNWTYVIRTGGGYHGYIRLNEPATPDDFGQVEKLNKGIAIYVGSDRNVCDVARILRVPGTKNGKYNPPRDVEVVHVDEKVEFDLDDLNVFLGERLGDLETEMTEITPSRPLTEEIQRVVDRCKFIQHCIRNASTLPEWAWYAMISNLCGFRGSVSAIHDFSRPYPGYSEDETNRKILHALDASRPITCASIQGQGFKCPQGCGVKAPAALPWRSGVVSYEEGENPRDIRDRKLKALVADATPKSGFIADYIHYAEQTTDAPRIFHLFCGLSVLSSAVGRRAWIQGFGNRPLYPNLWSVLVAPSTNYRKSTAIGIAEDLMKEIGTPILPQDFSQEMLIQMLSSTPQSTFVWSEFGIPLGNFQKEYMSGIKDVLAHLYDCPDEYERSLMKGTLRVEKPYINILGGTNIKWLLDKNFKDDLRGGLMARILWVPYTSKDFELDMPGRPDAYAERKVKNALIDAQMMRPAQFGISNVRSMRKELQEELEEVAKTSEYTVELSAAFARYQAAALKIAVLMAIADGKKEGEVEKEHFARAMAIVRLLRTSVEDIVRAVPLNKDDKLMVEITAAMQAIHEKDVAWVSTRDICRHTHRKVSQINETLETMVEVGRLKRKHVKADGGGRPSVLYQLPM